MQQVLVIIVTFNGSYWIEACLSSLFLSTYPIDVMSIDNASTDDTCMIIEKSFPTVSLKKLDKNLGFGQANNIAMKYALGKNIDFVFLLNQDAYVAPDTIEKLVSIYHTNKDYGIISPVQLNGKGDKLDILFKGFISNNYPKETVETITRREQSLQDLFPVHFVNAASWFIPIKCLRKVGLFHPIFYHYGEDNHYCSRVEYHGFKVGITPKAVIRHDKDYGAVDSEKLLFRKIELDPLYILLDIRKNIVLVYLLVGWKIVGFLYKGIKKGNRKIIILSLRRAKWILSSLPEIWRIRKETKRPFCS